MKVRPFTTAKPVIGMIHAAALPGTPGHRLPLAKIVAVAEREAALYRQAGVDGVALENMHDTPYLRGGVGPEIVACMTVVAQAVKAAFRGICGIQILAAANREAIAVAQAAGFDWVRVEGFAFAHVADEGLINSNAAELLRFRKQIGAERIQVWADIKKKHASHAITADVSVGETAAAAQFMRADAVIITGPVTGHAPSRADVTEAHAQSSLPVLLGSGVDASNVGQYLAIADGFIIGSAFKRDGRWSNPVDPKRVAAFMKKLRQRAV